MQKKKIFLKIESATKSNEPVLPDLIIKKPNTLISFSDRDNGTTKRSFDFSPWYNAGIDEITSSIQEQIEFFKETGNGGYSEASIITCCRGGLNTFLDYCKHATASLNTTLYLTNIDHHFIEGYLQFLKNSNNNTIAQKNNYTRTKTVISAMGRRGLINIATGENALFPKNPFPGSNKKHVGEKPFTKSERSVIAKALQVELAELYKDDCQLTGDLVAYALISIAMRTGRNTVPLLEMKIDCLREHPKEGMKLLCIYKRRGNNSDKVPVRLDKFNGEFTSVTTGVVAIIERILKLTASVRDLVEPHLKTRLWLYTLKRRQSEILHTVLTENNVNRAIKALVEKFDLKNSNDLPLQINISRFRKTFENRIFEISGQDLMVSSKATGHTTQVADRNYITSDENAKKNWVFMGEVLTQELINNSLGATEKTPSGHCSNIRYGELAPNNGETCFNFLSCVRCKNYVLTGEDLHRLFSFYWLIICERSLISKKKWSKNYAGIIRAIDNDIVNEGIRRKVFSLKQVLTAKDNAKISPHPYWNDRKIFDIIL